MALHDCTEAGCSEHDDNSPPPLAAGSRVSRPWDQNGWHAGGVLFSGSIVNIGYTRCRPHDEAIGPEYRLGVDVVTFPRCGVFTMHLPGETYHADANQVIFQNADDVFRTSHPGACGDATTWISVRSPELRAGVARSDPAAADRRTLFAHSHGPCDPRAFLLHRALVRHLSTQSPPDAMLVEETAIDLVGRALHASYAARGERSAAARRRDSTGLAHTDLVEAVKQTLALRYAHRLTIGDVAASVHSSPFHLCRVFRERTGLPIHRYLNQIRLREAVERMAERDPKLAAVAVEVGFATHSHFTDTFRREFGTPPSSVRSWSLSTLRGQLATLGDN